MTRVSQLVCLGLCAISVVGCAKRELRPYEALCSQRPSGEYTEVDEVPRDEWIPTGSRRASEGQRLHGPRAHGYSAPRTMRRGDAVTGSAPGATSVR